MNAAMLALVGLTAMLAYWAAQIGFTVLHQPDEALPTIFHVNLGFWTGLDDGSHAAESAHCLL